MPLLVLTLSEGALVVSCRSALFAWLDRAATMLLLSTTSWGLKAASVPWANTKTEKGNNDGRDPHDDASSVIDSRRSRQPWASEPVVFIYLILDLRFPKIKYPKRPT